MKNSKYNKATVKIIFISPFFLASLGSCKKFIEVEAPFTNLNGENVYKTDATAISATTSIYAKMSMGTINIAGIPSVSYFTGLSSDELSLHSSVTGTQLALYTNSLSSLQAANGIWDSYYPIIYQANAVIEGLVGSVTLTPAVKQQLIGEAKFIRGFCYFYLVNLYGDVPLVLSTDHKVNSLMARTPASLVWQQIFTDLNEAQVLLADKYPKADIITYYPTGAEERVRPTKWVATALLARAYLYTGDWVKAEAQATSVISNIVMYDTVSLSKVFLKNGKEAIWQLQPVSTGWNTEDAKTFILPPAGPGAFQTPTYINKRLQFSFETGDIRKTSWLDSVKVGSDTFYYAHKYKSATLNAPVTEYNTVFRLAEQYLIRAEARAQQGNITGSQSDLNVIRKRAGLGNTAANTKDNLLVAISRERRSELFTEWGHRWLDLKRTNSIDQTMNLESPLKGGTWESFDKLYPISSDELTKNPNLIQTPGYN
jgi:starch-binding outer membrane protein, SusD/RagB family